MKPNSFRIPAAFVAVASMILLTLMALAQDSSATYSTQPAAVTTAPQLAYGVSQILQLAQAKVGDDTIISYIKNAGNSYGLNAEQIIYLRQQGLSSAVITTMLNQPKPGVLAAAPATSAPQPASSTVTAAPTTTYVQTVPATTYYYSVPDTAYYYYQPYYYPYYCYPHSYAWNPSVSFSFGWGGRWGGWSGGGFHGGGFHGGGFHGGGFNGGGFHGGGHH